MSYQRQHKSETRSAFFEATSACPACQEVVGQTVNESKSAKRPKSARRGDSFWAQLVSPSGSRSRRGNWVNMPPCSLMVRWRALTRLRWDLGSPTHEELSTRRRAATKQNPKRPNFAETRFQFFPAKVNLVQRAAAPSVCGRGITDRHNSQCNRLMMMMNRADAPEDV